MRDLSRLRRLAARRDQLDTELRDAIRDAHVAGASLREIAAAAGVSHMTAKRIVDGP